MNSRSFKKEHQKPITTGTRDAVETAIDLSKEAGQHTWESLARRVKGRFAPWVTRVRKQSESQAAESAPTG